MTIRWRVSVVVNRCPRDSQKHLLPTEGPTALETEVKKHEQLYIQPTQLVYPT